MECESTRIKGLVRDNIKLMMKLKVAKQQLAAAHKREQLLVQKMLQRNEEELDDDVFYQRQWSLDIHPDSCVYCRDYERSMKFDSVKDLEEFIQRNSDPRLCGFCNVADQFEILVPGGSAKMSSPGRAQ